MTDEMNAATAGDSRVPGRPAKPRRRRPCDVPWHPHGLKRARPYPCGMRCDKHTPAALQGKPEPQPGPGWPSRRTEVQP